MSAGFMDARAWGFESGAVRKAVVFTDGLKEQSSLIDYF